MVGWMKILSLTETMVDDNVGGDEVDGDGDGDDDESDDNDNFDGGDNDADWGGLLATIDTY